MTWRCAFRHVNRRTGMPCSERPCPCLDVRPGRHHVVHRLRRPLLNGTGQRAVPFEAGRGSGRLSALGAPGGGARLHLLRAGVRQRARSPTSWTPSRTRSTSTSCAPQSRRIGRVDETRPAFIDNRVPNTRGRRSCRGGRRCDGGGVSVVLVGRAWRRRRQVASAARATNGQTTWEVLDARHDDEGSRSQFPEIATRAQIALNDAGGASTGCFVRSRVPVGGLENALPPVKVGLRAN